MTHRMTALSSLFFILLAPAAATAGDPCPIEFNFHDVGAPDWLDRDQLLSALTSKASWAGISFASSSSGIRIRAVSAASPSAAAGLQQGDLVVKWDGRAITEHTVAAELLRKATPGTAFRLDVTRGDEALVLTLTLGAQDPAAGALIDFAAKQECTQVRNPSVTEAQAQAIRGRLFSDNRRFRCDDAHRQLKDFDYGGGVLGDGDIVFVRGSRRLLVSNPGWATHCISASSVDGTKLNDASIGALFRRVSRSYIQDRHANP